MQPKTFQPQDLQAILRLGKANVNKSTGTLEKIYFKESDGSFTGLDVDKLEQRVIFRASPEDHEKTLAYQAIYLEGRGFLLNETPIDGFSKAFHSLFFERNGTMMKDWYLISGNLQIKEKFNKEERSNTYTVMRNNTMSVVCTKVEGGNTRSCDMLRRDVWYKFNPVGGDYEPIDGSINELYRDDAVMSFFNAAKINGEENKPLSEAICLSDEQKRRVEELHKNFVAMLKVIGVRAYIDETYDKICYIRDGADLPENTEINADYYDHVNYGSKVRPIPFSALFTPEAQFCTDHVHDDRELRVVFKDPPKTVADSQ